MYPILAEAHVSLDWRTVLLILGAVQLLLAALAIPSHPRWVWLPGGALFVTLALFFSVS